MQAIPVSALRPLSPPDLRSDLPPSAISIVFILLLLFVPRTRASVPPPTNNTLMQQAVTPAFFRLPRATFMPSIIAAFDFTYRIMSSIGWATLLTRDARRGLHTEQETRQETRPRSLKVKIGR